MDILLKIIILSAVITVCSSTFITNYEWSNYKMTFAKVYSSVGEESNARFYYAVNKKLIVSHNIRYDWGLETYKLAVNQYSDMRFVHFAALFPPTIDIPSYAVPYTMPNVAPQDSFSYAAQGFGGVIRDEFVTICNSGWAYATATALEIYNAVISGSPLLEPLSAQNFIDCAGGRTACYNQVSQIAFDYLTINHQSVYPESDYPNRPNFGQGMCTLPANQAKASTLTAYSTIVNGDDATLKLIVNYVAPVVIRYNPGSFEFMHYSGGIFTQPTPTETASHYVTVVGYGRDALTSKDYWIVQNSLGSTWGELGLIRIEMNAAKPIAFSAIFPSF